MTARRRGGSRRWWLLGGLLVIIVASAVIARVFAPSEPVLRAGDEEAAATADYLLPVLSNAADQARTTERPRAVELWLSDPDSARHYRDTHWIVGGRDGARIPVTFFVWWEDRSFSGSYWGNSPHWGRSCQVFTVTAGDVTTEPVQCALDAPEDPWQ